MNFKSSIKNPIRALTIVGTFGLLSTVLATVLVARAQTPGEAPQPSATDELEEKALVEYYKLIDPKAGEKLVGNLNQTQVRTVYSATYSNPVSKLTDENMAHYDPTGVIGFCFGRAMAAQLTTRQLTSLDPAKIYKLFVIGDLRSNPDKPEWRFHVTTVVPGPMKNGKTEWTAIDPIMYKPISVATWINKVTAGWDSWGKPDRPKARFFLAPSSAVLPDIRTLPDPESGKHIIEFNFDPKKAGIAAHATWKKRFGTDKDIYVLTEKQTDQYFLVAKENVTTRFAFTDITVNSDTISYKNYFYDLLATFTAPPSEGLQPAAAPFMASYMFEVTGKALAKPTFDVTKPALMNFAKIKERSGSLPLPQPIPEPETEAGK